jgi:hypothetical protein
MGNDALKFRVFIPVENRYMDNKIDNPIIDSSGNLMWCYLDKSGNLKRYEHNLLNRERAVIERCTGIRDRNDKLIYEGDILRATCTDGKHIDYPVGWWDGALHLYYVDKSLIAETGTIQFCLRGLVSVKNCCYREIIGTIHDDQFRDAAKMVEAVK